jgi:hypothetical protein
MLANTQKISTFFSFKKKPEKNNIGAAARRIKNNIKVKIYFLVVIFAPFYLLYRTAVKRTFEFRSKITFVPMQNWGDF